MKSTMSGAVHEVIAPDKAKGAPRHGHRAVGHLIARNTIAASLLFGVQLVTGLIALPLALHALGSAQFGLVSFVTGFAVFLQFVELGISMGLARFVAAYQVSGDRTELQSFVSDSYLVAIAGNAIVLAGLVLIGVFGGGILNVAHSERTTFTDLCVIVGISSALNGILNVPRGILAGLQLGGLRMRRDMIGAVGPLAASLCVVFVSKSIITYTLVLQGSAVFGGILVLQAARRVLPWVRHVPRRGKATFRRFLGYSGYQVINQGADTVFLSTDRVVVQIAVGSVAVTSYTIVERLQKLADAVVSIPINAVIPAGAEAWARNDRALLEKIIRSGTRLYLAATLPPLIVLIGLIRPFLGHWVGAAYEHLALAGQLFVLSLMGPGFVRVFAAVLAGKGRFREQTTTKCAYAPINLAISIFLVQRLGVLGVIIPTTFYYTCIYPVVQFMLMRSEGFPVRGFLLDVTPMILAMAPVLTVLLLLPGRVAGSTISGFLFVALLAIGVAYALAVIALRPAERAIALTVMRRRWR